jgi:hypothetical protein
MPVRTILSASPRARRFTGALIASMQESNEDFEWRDSVRAANGGKHASPHIRAALRPLSRRKN